MSTVETIAGFRERQLKMLELAKDVNARVDALRDDSQARADAIQAEFETKRAELLAPLDAERAAYNADMKAAFGISDGERSNVLDLVDLVARLRSSG